jgi:hypothetical protein
MSRTAYIVGNGPSRLDYSWDGFSIGCNLGKGTDIVCVSDPHVLDSFMLGKQTPPAPVLLGPRSWRHVMKHRHIFRDFKFIGAITGNDKGEEVKRDPQNAGQVAALWAMTLGFSDIRLIGFDSLWTGSRETFTDEAYPKCEKFKKRNPKNEVPKTDAGKNKWKVGWDSVFRQFPEADLRAYCPEGSIISDTRIKRYE